MDGFEINKILAAIIVTILIVFGIGKFTDYLFYVEKPKQSAYKVELAASTSVEENSTKQSSADIKALLAMGDISHGEKVFKKCSACHTITQGGKNKIGPALWGVLGRQIGSYPDYKFSKAMASYGNVWSFEEINSFLIKPAKHIKGTKMAFVGLKEEKDRASVILYLNSMIDNALPTP